MITFTRVRRESQVSDHVKSFITFKICHAVSMARFCLAVSISCMAEAGSKRKGSEKDSLSCRVQQMSWLTLMGIPWWTPMQPGVKQSVLLNLSSGQSWWTRHYLCDGVFSKGTYSACSLRTTFTAKLHIVLFCVVGRWAPGLVWMLACWHPGSFHAFHLRMVLPKKWDLWLC